MTTHYRGPMPEAVWHVAMAAWERGVSVQSDFARTHSDALALCASLGWISTVSWDGLTYSRIWRITVAGLTALKNKDLIK